MEGGRLWRGEENCKASVQYSPLMKPGSSCKCLDTADCASHTSVATLRGVLQGLAIVRVRVRVVVNSCHHRIHRSNMDVGTAYGTPCSDIEFAFLVTLNCGGFVELRRVSTKCSIFASILGDSMNRTVDVITLLPDALSTQHSPRFGNQLCSAEATWPFRTVDSC